jgi:hypothetical protein
VPRIHGEVLKPGFSVTQSTISKYTLRGQGPTSQDWKMLLRNQVNEITAVDFLVVPSLTFERLFAFLVLGVGRRCILRINVTTKPRRIG